MTNRERDIERVIGREPLGCPNDLLVEELRTTVQELGEPLESLKTSGAVLGFAGLWFTPGHFRAAGERYLEAVRSLHRAEPGALAWGARQVAEEAGLPWIGKPLDRIIAKLAEDGVIIPEGRLVRAPEHRPTRSPRQDRFVERMSAALQQANGPMGLRDLALQLHVPIQAVEEAGARMVADETVARVGTGLVDRRWLEALARELAKVNPDGTFNLGDIRRDLDVTRSRVESVVKSMIDLGWVSLAEVGFKVDVTKIQRTRPRPPRPDRDDRPRGPRPDRDERPRGPRFDRGGPRGDRPSGPRRDDREGGPRGRGPRRPR